MTSELPETPQVRESSSKPSKVPGGRIKLLPYGKIARVCDLPKREMGKKSCAIPGKSAGVMCCTTLNLVIQRRTPFTSPDLTMAARGSSLPRWRYLARSKCTSNCVMVYLPRRNPIATRTRHMKKIKSRVCGVRRKKPCGSKLSRLENDTVFLSIYENFGGNQRWSNLLLHSGRVLAQDIKG